MTNSKMMSALVLGLMISSAAFAEADKHPCKVIEKACQAAGFEKGKHNEGKGLWVDCLKKIAEGQSVPGVTVSQEDVAACKAKRDAKKEKQGK